MAHEYCEQARANLLIGKPSRNLVSDLVQAWPIRLYAQSVLGLFHLEPHPVKLIEQACVRRRGSRPDMAGGPGFEPGPTESESAVLPLDYPPLSNPNTHSIKLVLFVAVHLASLSASRGCVYDIQRVAKPAFGGQRRGGRGPKRRQQEAVICLTFVSGC